MWGLYGFGCMDSSPGRCFNTNRGFLFSYLTLLLYLTPIKNVKVRFLRRVM
jgi:hypothetical protein